MTEVVYKEIEAKSALDRVKGMPFDWNLNPYVGCPHACRYCFSRAYSARYRDRDVGEAFDRSVEVKKNFVEELQKQLRRRPEGSVAIGSATDPYQPIEGKYQLTRRCLEALVDRPMPTSIVTKGPLVVRDIDVLKTLDEKTELTVVLQRSVRRRRDRAQDRPGHRAAPTASARPTHGPRGRPRCGRAVHAGATRDQ